MYQINTEQTALLANSKQSCRKLLSFFDFRTVKEVVSNLNSSFGKKKNQLAIEDLTIQFKACWTEK